MRNPIQRLYKPKVASRSVNLSVVTDDAPVPSAACEVTEYDSVTGMEQWDDSVFMQDFEDSVLTAPAPIYLDSRPANQQTLGNFDLFLGAGKNSA